MVDGAAADTAATPLIHMHPRMDTDGAIRVTPTMVGVTDGIMAIGVMTMQADGVMTVVMVDSRTLVDSRTVADSRTVVADMVAADILAVDMTSPIQDMVAEAIAADPTKRASNFTCTIV
jgi:hypothetical protein